MMFSIIIPMYNVEKYIERCINSAIDNGLSPHDYEIIIVDDESPDGSIFIVKKLMKKHAQISLISQKNKGLGGARNTAIISAKGDYIVFLDADDLLIKNSLVDIYNIIKRYEFPDILEFSAQFVDDKLNVISKFTPTYKLRVDTGVNYYNLSNSISSSCNKLYKTSFLNKHKLLFEEHIYAEDFEFYTRSYFYAKRVLACDILLESFVQSQGSITRNVNSKTKKKYISDKLKIIDFTLKFKKEKQPLTKNQTFFFNERLSLLVVNIFYQAYKYGYTYSELLTLRHRLVDIGSYFVDNRIKIYKKNLFRLLLKNCFKSLKLIVFLKKVRING